MTEHLLAGGLRERVVLGYGEAGLLLTAYTNPDAARVAVRALNDWTLEHWLKADERLYGLLLVSTAIPHEAAAEIRRLGSEERFVGIALGTNGLDRPFGQAVYHPIYEAANELELPIVIQTGSDTAPSVFAPPIGGGMASTYAETEAWGAHAPQTHLASLIMEGVFELFPNVKVMLVGGGVTWYPPFAWKLDSAWNHMRSEAPLLRTRPSEYLRTHVRLSTAGMERPQDPHLLSTAMETVPFASETLIYGSGYPDRGWEDPDAVVSRLPAEWSDAILRDNAREFFRFPDSPATVASGGSSHARERSQ
jgi:predicted TIM-barrel fold metal-dependent hydrolase